MTSEHLTEIANLLDVFFKGLTECGVLISYSVKLQVYVEDLEIIKIKNLISQLIQNLQTLYVKIPYPETKETIIYNETTNVITDSKCNNVFLKENENFVVICNPVTFTTSIKSSNDGHVNAVGVMTTRVAEQAYKNNGSLYSQISNNESNHRISSTESIKLSNTENDFNGDKINLENNNKVTKSLNSININNLKCIIIPSIRNTNRLENQHSLLQTNSCHSENNNSSTQFNAVDNSELNKKEREIKCKNDNLPEKDKGKDTGNLLQESSLCLLENKEQLGKEHVHDFTENVVHIIVETTDKPSNSIENENNQQRSEKDKQENSSDFVCVECNEIFDELFKLEMHLQQHKPTCYVCLQEFTSLKDLNEHCQTSHKGAGCFSCTICNKIFVTSNGLRKHNSDSHCNNRNNYTCDICNKMFVTKLGLTRHIDSHHGKKTAVCDICGKSFRRSDYLQIHNKIHLGKRTFSCKLCPKKFLRHMQLKAHEKVHSGVKDHVCDICNKGFGRSDKLKEHMLRHLNIKRFQCKVCKKHYAENRDLKRHLKRHF